VPQVDAAGHLKPPQLKDVLCGTDPSVDLMESTGSLELGELSVLLASSTWRRIAACLATVLLAASAVASLGSC
jgi:hypothetical protein